MSKNPLFTVCTHANTAVTRAWYGARLATASKADTTELRKYTAEAVRNLNTGIVFVGMLSTDLVRVKDDAYANVRVSVPRAELAIPSAAIDGRSKYDPPHRATYSAATDHWWCDRSPTPAIAKSVHATLESVASHKLRGAHLAFVPSPLTHEVLKMGDVTRLPPLRGIGELVTHDYLIYALTRSTDGVLSPLFSVDKVKLTYHYYRIHKQAVAYHQGKAWLERNLGDKNALLHSVFSHTA